MSIKEDVEPQERNKYNALDKSRYEPQPYFGEEEGGYRLTVRTSRDSLLFSFQRYESGACGCRAARCRKLYRDARRG